MKNFLEKLQPNTQKYRSYLRPVLNRVNLLRVQLLRKLRIHKRIAISITAGLVFVCIGLYSLYPWIRVRVGKTETPFKPEVIIGELNDQPSEIQVQITDNFKVAADQPRLLRLPSLNVEGYIQKVGVDKKGRMAVPSNIHVAGWFVSSVKPGDEGLSIIDGHYGGRYSNAIFYELNKLKQGDTFSVQYGDFSLRDFKVTSVKDVTIDEAQTLLYERDETISSQLNLITCGGSFNKSADTYDKRVIVVAERI